MPTAEQIKAQFPGYQSWNDPNAIVADFNATGGVGKGGGSSSSGGSNADQYVSAIASTISTPPEEYLKANPFYFDEASAKEASTTEYSPYYDEILSDYMKNIDTEKEKAQGDLGRFLSELDRQTQVYTTQNKADLNKNLDTIRQGYMGNGLSFSGFENKDLTNTITNSTNNLNDYLGTNKAKSEQQQADTAYNINQYNTQGANETRDIGREKTTAIEGGVQQRQSEALQQYLYGAKAYYGGDTGLSGVEDALYKQNPSLLTSTSSAGTMGVNATTLPNNNLITV